MDSRLRGNDGGGGECFSVIGLWSRFVAFTLSPVLSPVEGERNVRAGRDATGLKRPTGAAFQPVAIGKPMDSRLRGNDGRGRE